MKLNEKINRTNLAKQNATVAHALSMMENKTKSKLAGIFILLFAVGLTGVVTSCDSSAEKVEKAEVDVIKAKQDLEEAKAAYHKDVEKHRNESKMRIKENNQRIVDFKARIDSQKKEVREEYKAEIYELEQKNTDMKKRLDDFKADTKESWLTFKDEFNEEMNELVTTIQNFVSSDK